MIQLNRNLLPGNSDKLFLTDGGLETVLIYNKNFDLPHFAAFPLLNSEDSKQIILDYFEDFIKIAKNYDHGFLIESPTWRANPSWGYKLGYSQEELNAVNELAITELKKLKEQYGSSQTPILVSGCVGPAGDSYFLENCMTSKEAENFHSPQIRAFKKAGADYVTALTLNYVDEALGVVNAARSQNIPVVISFTVETDGNLPSGQSLKDAIAEVDEATNNYVEYYMINCAHPNHFEGVLKSDEDWKKRIKGIRANASKMSHAELDVCEHLDAGDKHELADDYNKLFEMLPNLKVVGGCCGTDHNHIEEICKTLVHVEQVQ